MSGRWKRDVRTTSGKVDIYTAKFSIANATGTLINSTDMQSTVAGGAPATSPGQFTIQLGADNTYRHLMHFEASLPGQAVSATGSYSLVPVTGSATAGTLTVQLLGGPFTANHAVTGQSAAEVAKAGLTGSVFAVFKDTDGLAD